MSSNGNTESNFGLLIGIVIAIVVGALVGGFAPGFAKHTEMLGDIFLTLLKMVVVPLVIFSMVVGITNLGDIRNLGSIGGRTVLYYMATTAISVIIGMILVNIIAPGKGIELSKEGDKYPQLSYTLSGENNLTVTLLKFGQFLRIIVTKSRKAGILSELTNFERKIKWTSFSA